jgi:hypothetical protein
LRRIIQPQLRWRSIVCPFPFVAFGQARVFVVAINGPFLSHQGGLGVGRFCFPYASQRRFLGSKQFKKCPILLT